MKVLENGLNKTDIVYCHKCGSKLEINSNDLLWEPVGYFRTAPVFTCPVCWKNGNIKVTNKNLTIEYEQIHLSRIKERLNKELYDTLRNYITTDEPMAREEQIRQEALKAEKEKFPRCAGDKENSFHGVNSAYGLGFVDGALWADTHHKSHWISVKDDLPYKHNELISPDDKRDTKYVFTLINGCISLNMMYKLDGKWHWKFDKPTHWFSIPELPKE